MSLSLKYLVPLNLVILGIWTLNFFGSQRALERTMIATEREAMEQIAYSLKAPLERALLSGTGLRVLAPQIESLAARWPSLDIMLVDPAYSVRLASDPARVGRRWYEPAIQSEFSGRQTSVWNLSGHLHDERPVIDVSVAVTDPDGEVAFVIHIAKLLERLPTALEQQRRQTMAAALGELAAVAVAINLLTYLLVLRPLQRIRRRIGDSEWLAMRPQLEHRDEIKHLEAVVAAMLEKVQSRTEKLRSTLGERESALRAISAHRDDLESRVERVSGALADAESRLVRAERLSAVAQLSGALAHEIRNPLHIIRATAETVARRSPEVAELSDDIKEEVDRINRLISELLNYSRPSDLQWERIDIGAVLEEVRRRMCRGACNKDPAGCDRCTIEVAGDPLEVEGDPVLIEQAVMNLFANARDATGGRMSEIRMTASTDGDGVVVTVFDRGPGISNGDRDRIFEPFFTRTEGGTGLGLPVVQRIADLHEGVIELENRPGGGTMARLRLPVRRRGGAP